MYFLSARRGNYFIITWHNLCSPPGYLPIIAYVGIMVFADKKVENMETSYFMSTFEQISKCQTHIIFAVRSNLSKNIK